MLTSANNSVYSQLENIKNSGFPITDFSLGIGSISFLNNLDIARLKNIGVTILSYNPEGGHTPAAEFKERFTDSDNNPLVQFAKWGENNGFKTFWAPLRNDADSTPDSVIKRIYAAGMDGLGLQEQQFIEKSCPSVRTVKVKETLNRHRQLAGKPIETTVQIMANRCLRADNVSCADAIVYPYQHCQLFVNNIKDEINALGVWPSTDDLNFIKTLRSDSLLPTASITPTPTSPTITPSPTVTPTVVPITVVACNKKKYGDADCDGKISGIDYSIWLNSQCYPHQGKVCLDLRANFNQDKYVDGLDFVIWLNNRGKN
ncbi:MAG: hypothetical protein UW37_C0005G0021 [Candidatus Gottesmanbacteria bacterium GW2011_GWA2_44_17]|nr:MAG: hypothetical protein UV46_C0018G0005 [Candidatus Gottesmanbacteria bacterium GW2011_GWC2_42_8]KKT47633.1 MAG: hypothetical protein UW37_C0005G0021 [Candidatus Gottesmanbacteria bacterium GW2011_GWA2_44_17]